MKNFARRPSIVSLAVGIVLLAEIAGGFPVAGAYALGANGAAPAIGTGTVAGYLDQAQRMMNSTSALPVAPSWLSSVLYNLGAWFSSMAAQNNAAAPSVPTLPGSLGNSFGNIIAATRNFLLPFDAWFYGIAHVHIIVLFDFIFGVVNWILGLAMSAVAWLNSTFKGAAGR